MKLKELQKQFAQQIYNPQHNKIFGEIKSGKIDITNRIEVYRNNVFGNFDSVLEMIYPAIKQLVGEDYFNNLCHQYHQQYPSQSGNLNEYGKYFSRLIGNLKNQHKLAYLQNLASLEWQYHLACFAKDVAVFEIEKFQKLNQKDLFKIKFKLHPSCRLIFSKYPVYDIWQFTQKKKKKLNLKNLHPQYILIERSNWQTNIHHLTEPEFCFLKELKNKQNLYQIYQNLSKQHSDFDVGTLLNKYISNGVLSSFNK